VAPPIVAAIMLALYNGVYRFAVEQPPDLVAAGCALGLVVVHVPLLVSVVRRAAEGEGGAAALVLYPVPASILHGVETLAALPSLIVLVPGVVLAGLLSALSNRPLGLAWALVAVFYLASVRQLFRLLLGGLLRRRGVREVVLASGSLLALLAWLLLFTYGERIAQVVSRGLDGSLPSYFWWLPAQWFVLPAASTLGADIPFGARHVGWLGAPLLASAVFVAGAELQRAALLGESASRHRTTGRAGRRRWGRALDRRPLSWVPGSVWAIAGKELRLLSRNPFFVVMLLGQVAMWIALPFLYAAIGVRVTGGSAPTWLPFVAAFSLLGMQSFTFNQLGSEGRGMHFLAGSPVPRMHILLGKNMAYAAIGGPLAALSILVAAAVFQERGAPWFILVSELGVLVMLGVGNVVSVLLPRAILGARGVSGGAKAADVSAAGALPPNGCLVSIVSSIAVMALAVLMAPVVFGIGLAAWKGGHWPAAVLPGAIAYCVLMWLALTALASARLQTAEVWILSQIAGREAG
jgi:hypothetical protein